MGYNLWFGFAEVPPELHDKFKELPPLFSNKTITSEMVLEHMREYQHGRGCTVKDSYKLTASLSAKKILLYAPILRWYIYHGLKITALHRLISYDSKRIFTWRRIFVEKVTEARRTGDVEKDKALLTDVYKLLGNNAYGKLIEALERRTSTIYTADEDEDEDEENTNFRFAYLDESRDTYKTSCRKRRVTITRPFQIGTVSWCTN